MIAEPAPLGTLWIGRRLGFLELICLKSMVAQGHDVTVFSYDPIENLPEGVRAGDARAVHDISTITVHERSKSPAPQSDAFRLRMIRDLGLIWVDCDILMIRPLIPATPWVFGWESDDKVCNAVLGLPQDSPALAACIAATEGFDEIESTETSEESPIFGQMFGASLPVAAKNTRFTAFGPDLVTNSLRDSGELVHAAPRSVFYPIAFGEMNLLFQPDYDVESHLSEDTVAIHLWGRKFRKWARRHAHGAPRFSYVRKLARTYGVRAADDPSPPSIGKYNALKAALDQDPTSGSEG